MTKVKGWHIGLVGIAIAALIIFGVVQVQVNLPGQVLYEAPDGTQFTNYNQYLTYMQQNFPGQQPTPITPTEETHAAAQIQFSVVDFILKSGITSNCVADISKATNGVFDFMTSADPSITVDSAPEQGAQFFPDGAEIIIHADCTGDPTGGAEYYDGWYYCKLHEGNSIYFLTFDMLQKVSSYTYKVSTSGAAKTGYVVTWTSGTTNYWDIGHVYIFPRLSADNFDIYLTYQGQDLAKVTAGGTASNFIDTDAEITANATLASTNEDLKFAMYGGAASLGWGWSVLGVTTEGEVVEYEPVIIVSTAMTAIGVQDFLDEGWKSIADGTLYAEKAFYKPIGPYYPSKGSKIDFTVNIPIDSAAAASSTAFLFRVWIIDMQRTANVAIGSVTTTMPTAYGFINAYGPQAAIQARAYTTSSGAGSGEALRVYCTTP